MKQILLLSSLLLAIGAQAEGDTPLWLRGQRISPDGSQVAFCYQGDIYTVPTSGGSARRITTHPGYDSAPVWSPDSKQIAFASDREGSDDLYIVSAEGGQARRLTVGSGRETPVAFLDEKTLLFRTYLMPDRKFGMYPHAMFEQVYTMPVTGGRPQLFSSVPMQDVNLAPNGAVLYTDVKGYEDPWRKHHTSAIARDVWLMQDGKYQKLTNFSGEDRNAVWDGKRGFYYLSEMDGTFNIYHRATTSQDAKPRQMTNYIGNPVRFLSRASDGTLCYGYDGEIYTLREREQPRKLEIRITSDAAVPTIVRRTLDSGLTSFAVAPSTKEIAFVVSGDVYVTNVEYGTTKRITNTAEQERNVDFAPDGRSLVYSAERGGNWNIYQTSLVRKEDRSFAYAQEFEEKALTKGDKPSFQPQYSPDGKEVAFLRDRTAIVVHNLKTGKEREVMPSTVNYSYRDGDQSFAWSPDSKYILTNYQGEGGWMHTDCAIYMADGSGKLINLTESGYNERDARWVLGGKAVLFFSDRAGYRSHGSWGADTDLYIMFLDQKAFENFKLNKEERALAKDATDAADKEKKAEEEKKKAWKKKGKGAKDDKEENKKSKVEELRFAFDFRDERTIRLTRASGSILDAVMNSEGTKLYYLARFERDVDLWEYDVVERSTKVLVHKAGWGSLTMASDGKTLFLGSDSGLKKLDGASLKPIKFSVEFEQKPQAERLHIFEHVWQQVQDKFYDPKMHGVDWAKYKKVYAKFLPQIHNDRDLAELLSEMLGELNASHTGAMSRTSYKRALPTGALGAFFDSNYLGDGLRIEEILPGGPLYLSDGKVKEGMIIEYIDGVKLERNRPLAYYLQGKAGKKVRLTLKHSGKSTEVEVKATSFSGERELLYERWLRQRAEMVRQWSGGRVGYVYVRNMNSPSFRTVFKELMGKYRQCDAVIVDTRYNGGGWLHEDLAILLSGRKYMSFTPRGQYMGDDPFMQWTKPSCVLMSEGNYSNGHGFPWVYKELGIGKLIGTPVAGTMTAVWWESVFNGSVVFGVPQVTCTDLRGNALENQELQPDVLVYNTPEDNIKGEDAQLRRAVEEMLRAIDNGASK